MIFSKDQAEHLRMCAGCPKMCRHVCPTFFAWRSDSPTPHGRALILHQELLGIRELDDRAIEVLYQCLECSHCLTFCKPEIDIASLVEERRKNLVEKGRQPSGLHELTKVIQQYHNPYAEPHESRNNWLHTQEVKGKSIFYFTGCTSAYRERVIASDTIELLHSLNFDVKVSPDEWCCGSPLFRTGDVEQGLELVRHNVAMLNEIDTDEIVVTCPGCYRVLTQDYPSLGLELNKSVLHISQILANRLDDLEVTPSSELITYHDPCHLGRHCNIYNEPRRVIEKVSGKAISEMERTKENAMCCGNGAGLRTLFSEKAKVIGAERIQQAKQTGADILVTACPFCKNMLESQSDASIRVMDLPEFVMLSKRSHKANVD